MPFGDLHRLHNANCHRRPAWRDLSKAYVALAVPSEQCVHCARCSLRSFALLPREHSYASAVFGVVILSVRLSVRQSHACFVTTPKMHCGHFDTTRKGNHSVFLTLTLVSGRRPFRLKFALKMTHPFEKRPLRQISAYNVSTVRDSEKSSNMANR